MFKVKRFNLDHVVRNVVAESEKIGYDPTKDTNWSDMPPKIRMECIEKMSFKTRCRLRRTSKMEKSLIEENKYHFDKFCICGTARKHIQYSVSVVNGTFANAQERFEISRRTLLEKKRRFIELVMNTCEVDNFYLYSKYECPPTELVSPFRCRRFTAMVNDWTTVRYFLDKCLPPETIDLSLCDFPIGEAAAHPTVLNATKIIFGECEVEEIEVIGDILCRWVEMDACDEKTLMFKTEETPVPFFTEKFADRVVYSNDVKALIRMDDPLKQVLVWITYSYIDCDDVVLCRVIPTGLTQSQYSEHVDSSCFTDVAVSLGDPESEIDDNNRCESDENKNADDYISDEPEDSEPVLQMQKIRKAVLNVAEESEKCGYNPETDTNWCHLPMEMRAECIKHMRFRTRIRLSITSTTENSLANPKTYSFDVVKIRNNKDMKVSARNETDFREYVALNKRKSPEKRLQFAVLLCKTCEIKDFHFAGFNCRKDGSGPETQLGQLVPFRFKRFTTESFDPEAVLYILNNCTQLERITVYNDYSYNVLTDFPDIVNIKELRLDRCKDVSNVWALIRKWIEVDAEVGKSIQFKTRTKKTHELFASEFADRIVEDPEYGDVAIRMNHRSKQIILKTYGDISVQNEYISCRVIDTDGPVEHGKDEWLIERFYEEEDELRNYSDSDFE